MHRSVIFDMDGVIIDSEHLWERTEKILLASKGLEYDDRYRYKIIGLNQIDSALLLKAHFDLKDSVDFIIGRRIEILLGLYDQHLNMKEGIPELLNKLSKKGFPIALASSSPGRVIDFVLDKFDLKKFFNIIVSGESTTRGKPHPDIYIFTSDKLGIPPSACIVIEDSANGVKAAKNAGMYCIAVPDRRLSLKEFLIADEIEKDIVSLLNNCTINTNIC